MCCTIKSILIIIHHAYNRFSQPRKIKYIIIFLRVVNFGNLQVRLKYGRTQSSTKLKMEIIFWTPIGLSILYYMLMVLSNILFQKARERKILIYYS